MRRFFSPSAAMLIAAVLFVFAASGCETVKGLGRDITDASTSVQQTLFE